MSRPRSRASRLISTHTIVVLASTMAMLGADSVAADTPPAPPFNQCPAIGQDASCAQLIVVNSDGTTTVLRDLAQPPFDGIEDTLVGVQNNSTQTVYMIPISSSSSASIFGFDGDGICSFLYNQTPAGCPFGPSGYEGPNTSFMVSNANNGTINFPQGLAPGASSYFSLGGAATAADIVVPRYIALGDSYSSGEGVLPFIWPTNSSTNQCHRSYGAYPQLLQNRTGVPPSVEFSACSGAQIRSFYNSVWGEPPQIDSLTGAPATLVTLGVGGNDIGFDRIVRTCTDVSVPFLGQQNRDYHANCGLFLDQPGQLQPNNLINGLTWGTYNAQDNVFYSLGTLYRDVRVRAPLAQVYVVGYPNPLLQPWAVTGDCQADVLNESGNTVGFGPYHVQFKIHLADVNWMEKILARLNSTIQLNAADAGFNFVDNSFTLSGHDVCGNSTNHWVRGVVVKNNTYAASVWSFHPTYQGQAAIANAVSSSVRPVYGVSAGILTPQSVQSPANHPLTISNTTPTEQFITVEPGQLRLTVEVALPGKDVQASLVSPSGLVYDRTTQGPEVIHHLQSHGERFIVKNPEPGRWTIKLDGANVGPGGEQVRVRSTQIPRSAFAPIAAIKASTDRGVVPATIRFSGASSTSYNGATIGSFSWDFGDGTSHANGPRQTHVYTEPGSHTVTLTVTDSKGQTDSATQAVVVTSSDQPPTASFIWGSLDPNTPTQMNFDASASTDVDGQIATYAWNFGDGTTGNGALAAHRYAHPGRHSVTLTVTDDGGQASSFCQEVKTGKFSGGPVVPCGQSESN